MKKAIGISILQPNKQNPQQLKHCKEIKRRKKFQIFYFLVLSVRKRSFYLEDGYPVALKPGVRSEKWQRA